jgi:hypothetical protein
METQDAVAPSPRSAAAPSALAPLPHAVVVFIFSLVPADTRLRCREVCRGWRATLDDCGAWLQLDLRPTAGLARRATDALLHAAAARAGGQLRTLDVTGRGRLDFDAFMAVVRANPRCEELRCGEECFGEASLLYVHEVEAVFLAAPMLHCFSTDVSCDGLANALRLLRNERGFEPLRVRNFKLQPAAPGPGDRPDALLEVITAVAAHGSLTGLCFASMALNAAALDTLVDAALARRMTYMKLYDSALGAFAMPALVRLLQRSAALSSLLVDNNGMHLLDAPGADLLGNALRANSTLTSLEFVECDLWREPAAATTLLRALHGHASLRCIDLAWNGMLDEQTTAGAELAALVAADAPALAELKITGWGLCARGLRPLFEALAANTHLRTLRCEFNLLHQEWHAARIWLMPALAANVSLRSLVMLHEAEEPADVAAEAEAFVERRRAHAEATGEAV